MPSPPPPPTGASTPAHRHPPGTGSITPDAEALAGLARTLLPVPDLEGLADPHEPLLVLVTPDVDDLEVALRPAGGDPAVALRGLTAPPGCTVVGVVAPATLRSLDAPAPEAPGGDVAGVSGCARRARVALLVDADGGATCAAEDADGGVETWRTEPGEPVHGRILDAGRRVLGLTTPPPPPRTHELWTSLWLERLRDDDVRSWEQAVLRHPAAAVVPELIGAGTAPGEALVEAAEALGALWSWDGLRRAVARGHRPLGSVAPADAAWFDAGSFARAVLEDLPPPLASVAALDDVLEPDCLRRVEHAVRSLLDLDDLVNEA